MYDIPTVREMSLSSSLCSRTQSFSVASLSNVLKIKPSRDSRKRLYGKELPGLLAGTLETCRRWRWLPAIVTQVRWREWTSPLTQSSPSQPKTELALYPCVWERLQLSAPPEHPWVGKCSKGQELGLLPGQAGCSGQRGKAAGCARGEAAQLFSWQACAWEKSPARGQGCCSSLKPVSATLGSSSALADPRKHPVRHPSGCCK